MFAVFCSRGPAKGRFPEPQPSADPAESFFFHLQFYQSRGQNQPKSEGNQIRDLHAVSFPGGAGRGEQAGAATQRRGLGEGFARQAGKILPGHGQARFFLIE